MKLDGIFLKMIASRQAAIYECKYRYTEIGGGHAYRRIAPKSLIETRRPKDRKTPAVFLGCVDKRDSVVRRPVI